MKNDIRIAHCGIEQIANGESVQAGVASELTNMREREQALEVVGEPQQLEQLQPGDRVLLVDGDRTLVLRGNTVLWDGAVVLTAASTVLSAHRVGELLVVVTEHGNEVLKRTLTGYTLLNMAYAIPQLHLAAVESATHQVEVTGYEFDVPYSTWQAPMTASDVEGLSKVVRNAYASMQSTIGQQGRYAGVMLARYGVRLWDDSYLWLSQPVMVGHNLVSGSHRATAEVYTTSGKYAGANAFTLEMESYRLGITMASGVGEQWRSMVKSIDVLVSTSASVIDASGIDYRCAVSTSSGTRRYLLEVGPRARSANAIVQQVLGGNWHVVASTSVLDGSGFAGASTAVSSQQVLPGVRCYAVSSQLVGPRVELASQPQTMFSTPVGGVTMEYNGRLYHAPQSLSTTSPWDVLPWLESGISAGQAPTVVKVTLSTVSGEVVITKSGTCSHSATSLNPYIAFPDSRATHIAIAVGSKKWEMDLSPLNGMAVYVNPSLAGNALENGTVDGSGSSVIIEPANGLLVVSTVGNPLVTQWQAAVSGNSIMGLAAACRPIYSGGFGRYPVYLFTDHGIMALPQHNSGNYGEPRLISQEVLAGGATPAMAGDAVWFVSQHGVLCRLSGSTVSRVLRQVENTTQLAWNGNERELWLASSDGAVRVLMPSGRTYSRSLIVGTLYSDAKHSLAVDSNGMLLNLSNEQAAMTAVRYLSQPMELDALMRKSPRRITWNVFTTSTSSGMEPQGQVELILRGERGSSCHGFVISSVRASGTIAAPLSRPILTPTSRTLRLEINGTLPSTTLVLPTHITV